jgi:AcrR family transcriptional regulator
MNASPTESGPIADRVLDAALACVARVGVAKTTLDDVAKEAGCARASV